MICQHISVLMNATSFLNSKISCEEFWLYLSKLQNFSYQYHVFRNLASLAKLILTLPHSGAATERIFSLLADAKKRKRTGLKLLDSLSFINANMKSNDKNCIDFTKEIGMRHLALHNHQIYDHKEQSFVIFPLRPLVILLCSSL